MCGRYHLNKNPREIQDAFPDDWSWRFPGDLVRYNVAPGTPCLIVRNTDAGPASDMLMWGFRPPWAERSRAMINARSETMFDGRMFKKAAREHRCLVIADGFYEPKGKKGGKRPWYRFHFEDERAFALAGIYTWHEDYESFAIATTAPNDQVKAVHDRMPVILGSANEYEGWMMGSVDDARFLCETSDMPDLVSYRVGDYVKRAGNEGSECIAPAAQNEA